MRYGLLTLLILISLPAVAQTARPPYSETLATIAAQQKAAATVAPGAPTVMIPWPKGCKLFCEGWMATYGTPPNDINHFVSNKKLSPPYDKQDWAANIDDARKVADARYKK